MAFFGVPIEPFRQSPQAHHRSSLCWDQTKDENHGFRANKHKREGSKMMVLLAAGTDTTVATLEWAMSVLVNNPDILKKAQNEIDIVMGHDRLITESDTLKIPYLQCIISEVLRMYPAGPLAVHESSEECSIGGYRVPSGTMMLANIWSIHNDPLVWDEPQKFKPERFEGCEAVVSDGFRLMPFGSGRRRCPGEGLALRMVSLTLGSILQCFEWERIGEEMVDMTEGVGIIMSKAQPLLVKCRPRRSMVHLLSQV
uniref:Cytochrome P450 n=1 Tax=Manihot esculenta TaxID=3983 RepID=A0A2C9VZJ9_MANES